MSPAEPVSGTAPETPVLIPVFSLMLSNPASIVMFPGLPSPKAVVLMPELLKMVSSMRDVSALIWISPALPFSPA